MKPPAPATPRLPPPALPPGASYPPVPPAPPALPPAMVPPRPPPSQRTFTCAARNDPVECAALGDFFYATNGLLWASSDWINAASGIPTDICTFNGVRCFAGRVSSFIIGTYPSTAFIGTLPPSVGDLSSLLSLQLGAYLVEPDWGLPGLTGTLPAQIGQLSSLVSLKISASMSGTVPASWSSLTSLQSLDLSGSSVRHNRQFCGDVPPNLAGIPPLSNNPLPPC